MDFTADALAGMTKSSSSTTSLATSATFDTTDMKERQTTRRSGKFYLALSLGFIILLLLVIILDLALASVRQASVESITINAREPVPQASIELTFEYGSRLSSVVPQSMNCRLDSGAVTFQVTKQEEEEAGPEDESSLDHQYLIQATCPEQDVESHASLIWELITNPATKNDTLDSLMENGTCDMSVRVRIGHIIPFTRSIQMPLAKLLAMGPQEDEDSIESAENEDDERELPVSICHMNMDALDLCVSLDLPSSAMSRLPSVVRLQLPALRVYAQPTYTTGMTISMDAWEATFDPNSGVEDDLYAGNGRHKNVGVFSFASQDGILPFYRPLIDLFLTDAETTDIVVTVEGEGSFLESLLGQSHKFTIRHYEQEAEDFNDGYRRLRSSNNNDGDAPSSSRWLAPFEEEYQQGAAHCMRIDDDSASFNFGLCWLLEVPEKRITLLTNMTVYDHGITGVSETTWMTQTKFIQINTDALVHVMEENDLMDVVGGLLFDWVDTANLQFDLSFVNAGTLWPFEGVILSTGDLLNDVFHLDLSEVTFLFDGDGMDGATGSFTVDYSDELLVDGELVHAESDFVNAHMVVETDGTTDFSLTGTSACDWDMENVWDAQFSLIADWDGVSGFGYMTAEAEETVSGSDVSMSGSLDNSDDAIVNGAIVGNGNDRVDARLELLYDELEDFEMRFGSNCTWNDEDIWRFALTYFANSEEGLDQSHTGLVITEESSDFSFSMDSRQEREDNGDLMMSTTIRHDQTDELTWEVSVLLNEEENFVMEGSTACFWGAENVWDAELTLRVHSEEFVDAVYLWLEFADTVTDLDVTLSANVSRQANDDLSLNATMVHNDDDVVTLRMDILFNEAEDFVIQAGSACFWNLEDFWDSDVSVVWDWQDVASTGELSAVINEIVHDFTMSLDLQVLDLDTFELLFESFIIRLENEFYANSNGQFVLDVDKSLARLDFEDVGRMNFAADIDTSWFSDDALVGARLDKAIISRDLDVHLDGTATFQVEDGSPSYVMNFVMPTVPRQLDVDISYFFDDVADIFTAQITRIRYWWENEDYVDLTARTVVGLEDSLFEVSASDSGDIDFAANFTTLLYSDDTSTGANIERLLLRDGSDTFVDWWMTIILEDLSSGNLFGQMLSSSTPESDLQMNMEMTMTWYDNDEALRMTADHFVLGWRESMYVEMPMEISGPIIYPDQSTPEPGTSPPAGQTYTFTGVTMRLQGMPPLTPALTAAFEEGTEAFYHGLYQLAISRRLAGEITASSFQTDVTVTGDAPDDEGNTITYDQSLTFASASEADESAAMELITAPFSSDETRAEYLATLEQRDETFAAVTEVDAPNVPVISSNVDDGEDGDNDGEGDNNDGNDGGEGDTNDGNNIGGGGGGAAAEGSGSARTCAFTAVFSAIAGVLFLLI